MTRIGFMNIRRDGDMMKYSISNYWKKPEKQRLEIALKDVNEEYFLKYSIETFQIPPWSFWKFLSNTASPTHIDLKSSLISGTLEQYIDEYHRRTSNSNKLFSITHELITAIISIENLNAESLKIVDVCCLHPSLISLRYNDNEKKFTVGLMSYIPQLFLSEYQQKEDRLMYISPEHLRYLFKKDDDIFSPDPERVMYSFAVLLVKMFTNRLPFVQGHIQYNANGQFASKPEIDWNVIAYLQSIDRNVGEFVDGVFRKTIKLEHLKMSKLKKISHDRFNDETCNPNSFHDIKSVKGENDTFYCRAKQRFGEFGNREVYIKVMRMVGTNNIRAKIENEYDIMRLCRKEEFISVYSLFYSKGSQILGFNDQYEYAHLVMEYNSHGNLKSYVKSKFPNTILPKQFMEDLTEQMLKALWFLHGERGIVHRSISLQSICICQDKRTKKLIFKLGDFASARMIDQDNLAPATTVGDFDYAAPEISTTKGPWEGYTYKVDLWLLGVMIYWTRTRFMPFSSTKQKVILYQTYSVKPNFNELYWKDIPEIRELCEKIFVFDDYERIGWPEIHRNYWGGRMGLRNQLIDYSTLKHVAYKIRRQPKNKL